MVSLLSGPHALVNRSVARFLPYVPRPLVWRVSRRYIAGVSLPEAFAVIRSLNDAGMQATLDVLGEDVDRAEQVDGYRDLYLEAIEQIAAQTLDCNLSIKLSEFGLRFDPERCEGVVDEIVTAAATQGNFVRIDMEDSSVTDATLSLYRTLRQRHRNLGIVLQACLRRTPDDARRLLAEGIAHVRLCKGIYVEPEAIAHRRPEAVNEAFRAILEQLLSGGAEKVGIATHDPPLVDFSEELLARREVPPERYEFQMLLGVGERLRTELVARGHPLRVYVPFGEHWHAYSLRRLRENPAIAGHVVRNLLARS